MYSVHYLCIHVLKIGFMNKKRGYMCNVCPLYNSLTNWLDEHLHSNLVLCVCPPYIPLICNVCPLYIPLTGNVHQCDIPVCIFTSWKVSSSKIHSLLTYLQIFDLSSYWELFEVLVSFGPPHPWFFWDHKIRHKLHLGQKSKILLKEFQNEFGRW